MISENVPPANVPANVPPPLPRGECCEIGDELAYRRDEAWLERDYTSCGDWAKLLLHHSSRCPGRLALQLWPDARLGSETVESNKPESEKAGTLEDRS